MTAAAIVLIVAVVMIVAIVLLLALDPRNGEDKLGTQLGSFIVLVLAEVIALAAGLRLAWGGS